MAPDADTNGLQSGTALGDDQNGTDDEDGISFFPVIIGGGTTSVNNYSVTVALTNSSGSAASLCGWIDWNLNGYFEASESVCTTVANGATTATLTWPTATLSGPSGSTGTFARFRLSTDAVRNSFPTGIVPDGEVEDYFITYSSPLPLTVSAFTAAKKNNTVLLHWTADNKDAALSGFIIERSNDGLNFRSIGSAVAQQANESRSYSYTDNEPAPGNNYYRLKIDQPEGRYSYSVVRMVHFDDLNNAIMIYPNPVTDQFTITGAEKGMRAKLLAPDGRILLNQYINGPAASISVKNIAAGVYILQLFKNDIVLQTFKVNKK